jgi:hypothetical protein
MATSACSGFRRPSAGLAVDIAPLICGVVMSHVADSCLYSRVDVVESSRGPLLMELELIEPELYFLHVPDAAVRMAREIAGRLA